VVDVDGMRRPRFRLRKVRCNDGDEIECGDDGSCGVVS
jgi:hypothetical protein